MHSRGFIHRLEQQGFLEVNSARSMINKRSGFLNTCHDSSQSPRPATSLCCLAADLIQRCTGESDLNSRVAEQRSIL